MYKTIAIFLLIVSKSGKTFENHINTLVPKVQKIKIRKLALTKLTLTGLICKGNCGF